MPWLRMGPSFTFIVVYHPPRSQKNKHTFIDFITEFTDVIEDNVLDHANLILIGDFNVHVDNPKCRDAMSFLECISSSNLTRHMRTSTHKRGHILDLIITRSIEDVVRDVFTL